MQIVSLVTQNGGTGKSSLAVSIAVATEERGLKVAILDLDPQRTTRRWFERRKASTPEVVALEAHQIPAALAALEKQGCDLVLIDTAGVDVPAAKTAMTASHLCLIPARPSVADIEAAQPTVQALLRLGRPFASVLNCCPPGRSGRTLDAFRALQLMGSVSDMTVAVRTDHVDALAQGLGVTERDPNGKAAAEIRDLVEWLLTRLEGMTDGKEDLIAGDNDGGNPVRRGARFRRTAAAA
jgi:chromosome partitioning protein